MRNETPVCPYRKISCHVSFRVGERWVWRPMMLDGNWHCARSSSTYGDTSLFGAKGRSVMDFLGTRTRPLDCVVLIL